MDIGRLLTSMIFIVVAIAAIIIYLTISWQSIPKECKTTIWGNGLSVLGGVKTCIENCWSKHNFGSDIYNDDCYVVSINSTSTLNKDSIEKILDKPKVKVYFNSLTKNVEYQIKVRYNSTGKEISLTSFEGT